MPRLRREALTGPEQARWNISLAMVLWTCRPWYQRAWLYITGRRPKLF